MGLYCAYVLFIFDSPRLFRTPNAQLEELPGGVITPNTDPLPPSSRTLLLD